LKLLKIMKNTIQTHCGVSHSLFFYTYTFPFTLHFSRTYFSTFIHTLSHICRPSSSPWAAPMHMVPKKERNAWRLCDYHALNSVTMPDHYPLPHIQDFTSALHGKNILVYEMLLKLFNT